MSLKLPISNALKSVCSLVSPLNPAFTSKHLSFRVNGKNKNVKTIRDLATDSTKLLGLKN